MDSLAAGRPAHMSTATQYGCPSHIAEDPGGGPLIAHNPARIGVIAKLVHGLSSARIG
jgi:hypothetical protein